MKIILIGFMGAGKSTIGKLLSLELSLPWIETDTLVFEKTGCKDMLEVFAKGGESLLREKELIIAKELSFLERGVFSTGGGFILHKISMEHLKQKKGVVFFLQASFEVLEKRIFDKKSRPLFQDRAAAENLYNLRLPLYLSYADYVIHTDKNSPQEICSSIQNHLISRDHSYVF